MIITLSNEELEAAIKQYLGPEYKVTNMKFVISRSGGSSTKAEVTATRDETQTYQMPEEVIDVTVDNSLDLPWEEPDEQKSLFPKRNEDG